MFLKHTMLASGLVLMATGAHAGCGLSGGNVNVLGNEFGAIQCFIISISREKNTRYIVLGSELLGCFNTIHYPSKVDVH